MAVTRSVSVGDRLVTVRELTVREVRDWLADADCGAPDDPIHALAHEDCSLSDLARMSDIAARDLEDYTPSELEALVATARKLNPHFFRVRAALSGVARLMLREAAALVSTAPPADSPPPATPASTTIPGAPS